VKPISDSECQYWQLPNVKITSANRRSVSVILLSAGRGTRFNSAIPKSLVDVGGVTLLERTISQIRANSKDIPIIIVTGHMSDQIRRTAGTISDDFIRVIHNENFANDQNIISAQTALSEIDGDAIIIEGDCIFNESSFGDFLSNFGSHENHVFTKGKASPFFNNAIIHSSNGKMTGYHKGERNPEMEMGGWSNMAGAILVNKHGREAILNCSIGDGYDPRFTYYFQPLVDNHIKHDISITELSEDSVFRTFNTEFQYLQSMDAIGIDTTIELVNVGDLHHVEGFSDKRVEWLRHKICNDGVWNLPICIDGELGIVMDGQHRMEVARALNFSLIPAVKFEHSEVDFWSLRENHDVSLEKILQNHRSGEIYPYKTVKYKFPIPIPSCSISLEELS